MSSIVFNGGAGSGGLIPATSNLTFYVATTGSDSNPGTSGSPFLTIQHAVNVAAQYNYQNLYFPTINVADGNYNEQVVLPFLTNCPSGEGLGGTVTGNTATPDNCTVTDSGTSYSFTLSANSSWQIYGFGLPGTYGGFSQEINSCLTFDDIDWSGVYTQSALNIQNSGCSAFSLAGTLTVSSSMNDIINARLSSVVLDNATITFLNNPVITNQVFAADAALITMPNFVNANTVTLGGGSLGCATILNNGYINIQDIWNNFPGFSSAVPAIPWEKSTSLGNQGSYDVESPLTGATITTLFGMRNLILTPAGTLATLTVVLPPQDAGGNSDGFPFTISTTQTITAITFTTSDGTTVHDAPTTLGANSSFSWIYTFGAPGQDWYPAGAAAGISATITTAKLTGGGANGSMTFTNGILTAQTPAT